MLESAGKTCMRTQIIPIVFALTLSACANNTPQEKMEIESKATVQPLSTISTPKEPKCVDCLSQEDNEFLESTSIPTPNLKDVLDPDGKPLK